MIYTEFFTSKLGFSMTLTASHRNVWIQNWEHLISDMIYNNQLVIWRKVDGSEVQKTKQLITNLTPKLRKMMRRL